LAHTALRAPAHSSKSDGHGAHLNTNRALEDKTPLSASANLRRLRGLAGWMLCVMPGAFHDRTTPFAPRHSSHAMLMREMSKDVVRARESADEI
jgi:hypothetical protein